MDQNPCYYRKPCNVVVRSVRTDIGIYGGTAAGIAAAIAARRAGLNVAIVNPSRFPGGMSSGGLGYTDVGNRHAIGGIAREFYSLVGKHYGTDLGLQFEPHVAEQVFNELIQEHEIPVYPFEFLISAERDGTKILSITCESGLTIHAGVFIDATYEGDLMAMAGVRFTTGRESNRQYRETINGIQVHTTHQFEYPVDPYRTPGVPASGLLPGIDPSPLAAEGEGDHRIQAYNFRMCLTREKSNRVPFPKPRDYNRSLYELQARHLARGWNEAFQKFDRIEGGKTDTNNHGAVSTDFIGGNYGWPCGSYEARERIFQAHVSWQQGFQWFMANDPSVPKAIRAEMSNWGLAKDEFIETGHWPHQLYIREARRMVSAVVMTEHHCRGHQKEDDVIGLAAYGMDSHNCRRFVRDGCVYNEGDVQEHGFPAYGISYRAIVPLKNECENLLVPVCLSASHIAYGSIRMEPVFMILGQSAGIAASAAFLQRCPVQDIAYGQLRERLIEAGQVLHVDIQARDTQTGE